MTQDSLMQACAELARLVGDTALGYYGRPITVEMKPDGSPVTAADRAAEKVAHAWLGEHFAEDGILGEELGASRADAKRRWIIDPIDGTKTFVRKVPLWGSLVAVAEGESVLAGAAYFPAVSEIISAATGCGCWWNGSRCSVSNVANLGDATVLVTDHRFRGDETRIRAWQELASRASVARTWGDCYGYLLVATGRAEAMADDVVAPWDAAALLPIVTEAGGSLTDWKGAATAAFRSDLIATNAALAREIRAILGVPNAQSEVANA